MGKKSRRQRVPNAASRRGATPGRFDESIQPKLTVAEAEAECRAAAATIKASGDADDNNALIISQHPDFMRAMTALIRSVTLNTADDHENLTA